MKTRYPKQSTLRIGAAFDPDGAGPLAAYDRAFLLDASAVPEPSGLAVLTLAVPALLRRRGRNARDHAHCETLERRQLLSLAPAASYPVGANPQSVVVADFNNDGRIDLATVNQGSNNVTVRLGTGGGNFGAATQLPVGSSPRGIAVGDFNNDGKPDLVTANNASTNVSVLLGTGSGTFAPATSSFISTDQEPRSVAVGDFNADGKMDLAVGCLYRTHEYGYSDDGTVAILFGNGAGSFTYRGSWTTGEGPPLDLEIADLNSDSRPDVIAASENWYGTSTVTVLPGSDNSLFLYLDFPRQYASGDDPQSVAVRDFTGDGILDILSAGQTVDLLRGNGNGTFVSPVISPATGVGQTALAVADVNADGKLDAVTSAGDGVNVLIGSATGAFELRGVYPTGQSASGVAVADFNGDGRPDVAVTNGGSDNVSVLLNDGNWPGSKTFVGPGGNGSGGNWANANNWSPTGVPIATDYVTIAGKSVNLGGSATVAGLTLSDGATLAVATNGGRVLRTGHLSIGGTSKLNLNDNDLIVDYAGASSPLGEIVSQIIAGRAAASQPKGLFSSQANASDGLYALGVGEAGDLTDTFSGQQVDDTAVLVKFTWVGDLNLDGRIEFQDLSVFNTNYDNGASAGRLWFDGDFNYDGFIDFQDLSVFNTNYDPDKPAL